MATPAPKVVYRQKVVTIPRKSRFSLKSLLITGLVLGLLTLIGSALDRIKHRWYIFDLPTLRVIQTSALEKHGNNTRAVIDDIVANVRSRVPESAVSKNEEWIFNVAGGAMGSMYIIHASITEYLIIFGTPIGTEGHTGRHTADDHFHILSGEQTAFAAGALDPEVYPAGSVHHLKRGTVKQYKCHDRCWALEYARGWIPPMFFFGFADGIFSTLDVETLWHTTRITGREMIRNLLHGKI